MGPDQEKLSEAFLLGKLAENEREDVERDFFAKHDVFENLLIAENTLTDAYVTGRMAEEDRRLFESRLLINPVQRQRAAFAETFVTYASRLPIDDTLASTSASNWPTRLSRLFSTRSILSYSLMAAVLMLLVGAAFWWATNNSRPSTENLAKKDGRVETPNSEISPQVDKQTLPKQTDDRAYLNGDRSLTEPRLDKHSPVTRHEPQIRRAALISTIVLSPGSTRGNEPAKSFSVPSNADLISLRLNFEDGAFTSYFAVVETVDGQQIWRGKAAKANGKVEKSVAVSLPARLIKRGDYIARLKGLTKDGVYEAVGDYTFSVDRH